VRLIAVGIDLLLLAIFGLIGVFLVGWATGYEAMSGNLVSLPLFAILSTFDVARRGKTPGKSLFELEVVALATGAPPTRRAAAIRALAMVGVPLGLSLIGAGLRLAGLDGWKLFQILADLAMPLVIVALLVAAIWSPNKRAFWDGAAGTIVRYRATRP
jgi:uncharacterized RDD family membrane protein YckC